MEVKKLIFILFLFSGTMLMGQNKKVSETVASRNQKKAEKRERINQLIKQEEEGALIYNKQSAFASIKLYWLFYMIFYNRGVEKRKYWHSKIVCYIY